MIRHIQLKDKDQWEKLYKGYADFYKVEMNDKILQTVWSWLQDKNHEVNGIVYEVDGNIVGLAHYRRMPRPLRGKDICFLDDLYVAPRHRGQNQRYQILLQPAIRHHKFFPNTRLEGAIPIPAHPHN